MTKRTPITAETILALLEKEKGQGSWASLAKRIGVSRAYLSDLKLGRRLHGPKILSFLKLQKKVSTVVEYSRA